MSFREKSAWITLITLVLVSMLFLAHFPWWQPFTLAPDPNPIVFHALIFATVTFVVIEIVAHVVVAIRSPHDAHAPKDERERLIALKATRLSAYVYAVLTLSSISLVHVGANAIGMSYCILFSFIIAEFVNYTARVVLYRRGVAA